MGRFDTAVPIIVKRSIWCVETDTPSVTVKLSVMQRCLAVFGRPSSQDLEPPKRLIFWDTVSQQWYVFVGRYLYHQYVCFQQVMSTADQMNPYLDI